MGGVEPLDHLDAGAAVFGDLVDVRAFHEAHTYVGMAQAVGCARIALPIELELRSRQEVVEHLDVVAGEYRIGRLRVVERNRWRRLAEILATPSPRPAGLGGAAWQRAFEQAFIGPHRPRHTLAIADAALAADLDLKNLLAHGIVRDDRHVAMLQVFSFVGTQAGIAEEQHKIVQLRGFPAARLLSWVAGIFPRGLIELLVFLGTEPGTMNDLALRPVGRGKIGQVVEPSMTDGGFEDKAQRHDLVMEGAARRSLAFAPVEGAVDAVFLNLAGGHLGDAELAEERQEMECCAPPPSVGCAGPR